MTITRVKLERFTAFRSLDFRPSPGINVFVGANGTGKTHLMKVVYAACCVSKTKEDFTNKLVRVFLPSGNAPGRLVKLQKRSTNCRIGIHRRQQALQVSFASDAKISNSAHVEGAKGWTANPVECIYIPATEMLANAPGFQSLYAQREIHFEEICADLLNRAHFPAPRDPLPPERNALLNIMEKKINGTVQAESEEFFLISKRGKLEFALLAEGMRKLGLLWLLIQNGSLDTGSILFWDEPETNLNPKLFGSVIEVLLVLQGIGVQIFIATHDYAILKELDLQSKEADKLAFHSLYSSKGEIAHSTSDSYLDLHPNAIREAFTDLYDREVERSLAGTGK